MKVVIQMTEAEESKALPVLLRGSAGSILPDRVYVLEQDMVTRLRLEGVRFTELSRESSAPRLEGVGGERI